MKLGKNTQFDTLKKKGCRPLRQMPPYSIFRLGYSIPYLYKRFYYNYVGNYDISMKLGKKTRFDVENDDVENI